MNKEEIIKKHIEGWSGLQKASIDHFAESGKVSGSFFIALKSMLDEHANLQTEQLKKQLEEKEKEIERLKKQYDEVEEARVKMSLAYTDALFKVSENEKEYKEHVEKLCRNIRILEERVKDGDKELSEQIEATNRNAEKGLLAVMELSELKAKHKDYVETFIQFYEQSMKLQEHTADQHFIDWEDESIEGVLDFENARKKAFLIIKYYTQTHGQ